MKKATLFLAILFAFFAGTNKTNAQVFASVQLTVAPPALPVYEQPECPTDGYLWTPGYWAWDPSVGDYYWVPGVWVRPARVGYLWTPGYWGFDGGYYGWHAGYWGETVGFYGGVNYGWGYTGSGFYGCRWHGDHYEYNTAVVRVNTTVIHNTYINNTVVRSNGGGASFNGRGGVAAQPTSSERIAMSQNHVAATNEQRLHQSFAAKDRTQFAKSNNGRPTTTAMNKVGGQPFTSQGHVANTPASAKTQQPVHHAPASQHNSQAQQQHANNAPAQRSSHDQQQHNTPAQHSNPAPQGQMQQHNNPIPAQHQIQAQHNPAPLQRETPQQHSTSMNQRETQPQHFQTPQREPATQQHFQAPQQRNAPALQPHPAPQQHAAPAPHPEHR